MPTVKIFPALLFPALLRLLAGVAVAALATACATSVPGEPAAQPGRSSSPSAPSPRPDSSGQSCQVRVSSSGSISSSGAGGRTVTINGRTAFSCASGPLVGIDAIDDSGVTFSVMDGPSATVTPGSTVTVGEYLISVTSVDGGAAEFEVEATG